MSYDPTRKLVMTVTRTIFGHRLVPGDPLKVVAEPKERGEIDTAMADRLLNSGWAIYADEARPTPVETPAEEARRVVTKEELGGGWFAVNAPWLSEPLKVQGDAAAQAAYDDTVAAGRPPEPLAKIEEVVEAPKDNATNTGTGRGLFRGSATVQGNDTGKTGEGADKAGGDE